MALSWHQLLELGKRIATSEYHKRIARADEVRVASAEAKYYEEWRDSINPDLNKRKEYDEDDLESTVTLSGVSVQEDL